jgi:hypothetical protein
VLGVGGQQLLRWQWWCGGGWCYLPAPGLVTGLHGCCLLLLACGLCVRARQLGHGASIQAGRCRPTLSSPCSNSELALGLMKTDIWGDAGRLGHARQLGWWLLPEESNSHRQLTPPGKLQLGQQYTVSPVHLLLEVPWLGPDNGSMASAMSLQVQSSDTSSLRTFHTCICHGKALRLHKWELQVTLRGRKRPAVGVAAEANPGEQNHCLAVVIHGCTAREAAVRINTTRGWQ